MVAQNQDLKCTGQGCGILGEIIMYSGSQLRNPIMNIFYQKSIIAMPSKSIYMG